MTQSRRHAMWRRDSSFGDKFTAVEIHQVHRGVAVLRPILTLTCVATIAVSLSAQEKPTADQQHAVAGTWKFDQTRSDTVNNGPLNGLRGAVGLGRRGGDGAGWRRRRGRGRWRRWRWWRSTRRRWWWRQRRSSGLDRGRLRGDPCCQRTRQSGGERSAHGAGAERHRSGSRTGHRHQ